MKNESDTIALLKREMGRLEDDLAQTYLDVAKTIFLALDVNGTVTLINKKGSQVLGYPQEEILGRNWFDAFLPENIREKVKGVFKKLVNGEIENLEYFENPIINRSGERRDIAWYNHLLKNGQGTITGTLSSALDITESKRAQRQQKLTKDILEILNNSEKNVDQIHEILKLLKSSTRIEAVGIRLKSEEDFPYYETMGFPADFANKEKSLCASEAGALEMRTNESEGQKLECICGMVIKGKTNPSLNCFTEWGSFWTNSTTDLFSATTDEELRKKNRNTCNAHGYESVALIPLKTANKTIGLLQLNDRQKGTFDEDMIHFFEDIGASVAIALARKKAEEALLESESRYRALFEKMINGFAFHEVVIGDRGEPVDYVFLEINEAFENLTGLKRGDIIGKRVTEVIPGIKGDPTNWIGRYGRVAISGEEARFEQYAPFFKKWFSVYAYSPKPGFFATVFEDISIRKQLFEQLLQSQKMESIGRLAAGVAHDFNNLLSPIFVYAELLVKDLPKDDPRAFGARQILEAAERSGNLTKQLLAFGRRQVLDLKAMDLNTVATDFAAMMRRIIREDIQVVVKPLSEQCVIQADLSQIEQVLMNLAVNAQDAMPGGGRITIETGKFLLSDTFADRYRDIVPGRYIVLSFSDTGEGMDPETLSQVFEPFFTTKVMGKGTGLGLSTSYGIIKQHGGNISVYSEPGKGTTFKLYFPQIDSRLPSARKSGPPKEIMGGTETILVVEDDVAVRQTAKRLLERLGYEVLVAGDGPSAISLAEHHPERIHLVLTDVIMPGMTGTKLFENIVAARPDTKVIFMSGYTGEAIAHHQVLDDDCHFIEKPFSFQAIANKIREVLDGSDESAK